MKTQEELNILKEEVKAINEKLHKLTEEELAQVTGGVDPGINIEQLVFDGTRHHHYGGHNVEPE